MAPEVIASAAFTKLTADFTGERFDLVVATGSACGPSARAVLGGLGSRMIMIDPPIFSLRDVSPAIRRLASEIPIEEFMDSMAEAGEPYAEEAMQGNPGPLLEETLGPSVENATDRWILDFGKQVMEQRMPLDPALDGSAGEQGHWGTDWLGAWSDAPSQVMVLLSRPHPLILEGLTELSPVCDSLVVDWRKQMWLHEPEVVAAKLMELAASAPNE